MSRLEMVPGDDAGLVCEDGVCALPAAQADGPVEPDDASARDERR